VTFDEHELRELRASMTASGDQQIAMMASQEGMALSVALIEAAMCLLAYQVGAGIDSRTAIGNIIGQLTTSLVFVHDQGESIG
jgi:hypothetical protein